MECLGVPGKAGETPLSLLVMEGWVSPVELTGLVRILTLLSLSFIAGGVTLTIGATGRFDSTENGLKESGECMGGTFLQNSMTVLQPLTQNVKVKILA